MPALTDPCASDLALDRHLSGEANAAATHALDQHLRSCVRCRVRYELLSRQRAELLQRAPDWRAFVTLHGPSRRKQQRTWPRGVLMGGAVAACAMCGWFVLLRPSPGALTLARSKGSPTIGFYIQRDGHVSPGASGDLVHPGDILRFTYTSEHATYLALLNADARAATVFHPVSARSLLVDAGRESALDFGVELDQQLGDEHVFGLFCDAPLELEPVRGALEASGHLPDLPGCRTDTLTLHKRSR